MIHGEHLSVRAPRYHALPDVRRVPKKIGPVENVPDERESMVAEHDDGKPWTIHRFQRHAEPGLTQQVCATIRGDTVASNQYACQPFYGVTTIPAYVTSTFRFQVFSYFNVAASYTSISNPAP